MTGPPVKRVFGIDIETWTTFGGATRITACIEYLDVIGKILAHLDAKALEDDRFADDSIRVSSPGPCL